MPVLDRLFPWPHGLLPRRSAAVRNAPRGTGATADGARGLVTSEPSQAELSAMIDRRSQALRTLFPLLFSRYARRSDLWRAIAIERFLSQASNLADLEQRIQEVQRRRASFAPE
jgi:hypothetical protein